jgi:hypothetical protein
LAGDGLGLDRLLLHDLTALAEGSNNAFVHNNAFLLRVGRPARLLEQRVSVTCKEFVGQTRLCPYEHRGIPMGTLTGPMRRPRAVLLGLYFLSLLAWIGLSSGYLLRIHPRFV